MTNIFKNIDTNLMIGIAAAGVALAVIATVVMD